MTLSNVEEVRVVRFSNHVFARVIVFPIPLIGYALHSPC